MRWHRWHCQPWSSASKCLTYTFTCVSFSSITSFKQFGLLDNLWKWPLKNSLMRSDQRSPSQRISFKHLVYHESPTLKTWSCWINKFPKRVNCSSTQIKKTTIVHFYIFKNVWFSNDALYVKYNKRALTKTTYTKIWFILSHNIYGFLLLWVHPKFVNL